VKFFIDTNVFLAGFISSWLCHGLIDNLAHHNRYKAVTSERVLAELERHLTGKFKWASNDVTNALSLIKDGFGYVEASSQPIQSCPDPDDAWILADALGANCSHFVTGDKALLNMQHIRRTGVHTSDHPFLDIISPRQMTLFLATGQFLDISIEV
jgi:putative PIN family toxin of toxin-antitoxin system